jgi:hypothetical protein
MRSELEELAMLEVLSPHGATVFGSYDASHRSEQPRYIQDSRIKPGLVEQDASIEGIDAVAEDDSSRHIILDHHGLGRISSKFEPPQREIEQLAVPHNVEEFRVAHEDDALRKDIIHAAVHPHRDESGLMAEEVSLSSLPLALSTLPDESLIVEDDMSGDEIEGEIDTAPNTTVEDMVSNSTQVHGSSIGSPSITNSGHRQSNRLGNFRSPFINETESRTRQDHVTVINHTVIDTIITTINTSTVNTTYSVDVNGDKQVEAALKALAGQRNGFFPPDNTATANSNATTGIQENTQGLSKANATAGAQAQQNLSASSNVSINGTDYQITDNNGTITITQLDNGTDTDTDQDDTTINTLYGTMQASVVRAVGNRTMNQTPIAIGLPSLRDPVIIAGPPTLEGGQTAVIRVQRDVAAAWFKLWLGRPACLSNSVFANEDADYIVFEKGRTGDHAVGLAEVGADWAAPPHPIMDATG